MIELLVSTAAGMYCMGAVLHPWCYLVCVGHSQCLRFYHFIYSVLIHLQLCAGNQGQSTRLRSSGKQELRKFSDGFGGWLKASHYKWAENAQINSDSFLNNGGITQGNTDQVKSRIDPPVPRLVEQQVTQQAAA